MAGRYVRLVSIWIHKGQEAAFEAFEREAVVRMAAHGGRIDAAVRTSPTGLATGPEDATPYEIHVVSFPDKAAMDAYASDPATLVLQEKRATIISLTLVMTGREAGPYAGS
ncbi:MAG: hypothetical protein Q8R02_01780 [Hyphomonadaceae bacterium]|nr:hypothetical protein [Hyphomonadaceae bacterium]